MQHNENNNKQLINNILIIGIGTILTKMISFIMIPFFSSWLSTDDFGTYDLIATYISLCVPFATLQLEQAVYRFTIENRQKANLIYIKSLQIVIPIILTVSVVVFTVMQILNFSVVVTLGFISYFVSLSLYSINAEYLRGKDKLKDYSIHNILVGVLTVILSIVLVRICGFAVPGLLFVFGISYGISTIIIIFRFSPWKSNKSLLHEIKVKSLLGYSIPLIPNTISWWIINVSDRTIIDIIQGSYYNGIYAICCKIPTMLSLVFSIFNLSFQQVAMQGEDTQAQRKYYDTLLNKLIRILFSGSIVIIGCTPLLYFNFLRNDYWEGIICVPVLLFSAIMLSLAQYVGDILLVDKCTKVIGFSTIIGALANIVINIILIPSCGIFGASIATLISYFLMFVVRFIYVRNRFSFLVLLRTFILYAVFFVFFSVIIIEIGNYLLFNILILICSILFFIVINRDLMKIVWRRLLKK